MRTVITLLLTLWMTFAQLANAEDTLEPVSFNCASSDAAQSLRVNSTPVEHSASGHKIFEVTIYDQLATRQEEPTKMMCAFTIFDDAIARPFGKKNEGLSVGGIECQSAQFFLVEGYKYLDRLVFKEDYKDYRSLSLRRYAQKAQSGAPIGPDVDVTLGRSLNCTFTYSGQ